MDDLPLGDIYSANEKVVAAIKEFNEQKLAFTRDRLEVLMHLDETSQDNQETLLQQYLRNPRMSRTIESRLWNAMFCFCREVIRGYHSFIMDYVANPSGSKIAAQIPLITARAIRYFGLEANLHYYRYEQVEPKMWKRLHNLYHFAEYEEFENKPCTLYDKDKSLITTCTNEYMRILMLNTLNRGSLYPRQIHMVDQWLDLLVPDIVLERDYDPTRHVFQVHLGETSGARRIRRPPKDELIRYWSINALFEHIERIKQALMNGELPVRLGLTEECRLPACLEFLERIEQLWSPEGEKRAQRAHERKSVKKMIDVLRGWAEICVEVKQDNNRNQVKKNVEDVEQELSYDEMVDYKLYGFVTHRTQVKIIHEHEEEPKPQPRGTRERWVMENESEQGYGAVIKDIDNEWVRLGKLVGLKPEKKGSWVIGVVRRLSCVPEDHHYVGIEIIAQNPIVVMLRPENQKSSGYTIDGVDSVDVVLPIPALYIKGDADKKRPDTLVLQSAEYATGRELELSAKGKSYKVSLNKVLERGDDWLRVSFNVLAKKETGTKRPV